MSLLALKNGFRLPAPLGGLELDTIDTGIVALLRPGEAALVAKKFALVVCWGLAEGWIWGGLSAKAVGSSGMVGIGCGAR